MIILFFSAFMYLFTYLFILELLHDVTGRETCVFYARDHIYIEMYIYQIYIYVYIYNQHQNLGLICIHAYVCTYTYVQLYRIL
jgi:hypothetical protein